MFFESIAKLVVTPVPVNKSIFGQLQNFVFSIFTVLFGKTKSSIGQNSYENQNY